MCLKFLFYDTFMLRQPSFLPPASRMQMQTGREREGSGFRGQPALQTGLWGQNREPAGGGGAAEEAQVKSRKLNTTYKSK